MDYFLDYESIIWIVNPLIRVPKDVRGSFNSSLHHSIRIRTTFNLYRHCLCITTHGEALSGRLTQAQPAHPRPQRRSGTRRVFRRSG